MRLIGHADYVRLQIESLMKLEVDIDDIDNIDNEGVNYYRMVEFIAWQIVIMYYQTRMTISHSLPKSARLNDRDD